MELISIAQENMDITQEMYEEALQKAEPLKPPSLEGLPTTPESATKPKDKDGQARTYNHPETVFHSSGKKPAKSKFDRRSAKKHIPADTLSSVVDGLKAVGAT